MKVHEASNKGMKWSSKNILTCSPDWPKEWPFSVQSSSTNVIIGLKHYNEGKLYSSHLEEDWML
jgi:hypothetical protein